MRQVEGRIKLLRFHPDTGPFEQFYSYSFSECMTVLDVLNRIYLEQDGTIAFPRCCRNGKCGLCTLFVNGHPVLACREMAQREMVIGPLPHFPVLRDLVVDRTPAEAHRKAIQPNMVREEQACRPIRLGDTRSDFLRSSRCIECLSCMAVCPVYGSDPVHFPGPMPLARFFRYMADPRISPPSRGESAWTSLDRCIACGACTRVCPEDVDPCRLICKWKESAEI